MKSVARCSFILLLSISAVSAAQGQGAAYPDKPVQIIADSAAGSTPDVALRFVTDRLGQLWGQQVLVVNKPGAGGSVAARAAADATPDGYTLYQPVLSTFVSLHPAAPNVPLHVPKDFLPIGFVAENPMFIAVVAKLGVNILPELIELAKKKPGEITYATTGMGRLTHLTGELLQHQAKIKLHLVPYTGGPAHAVSDVATGRVAMIIEGYSGIAGAARRADQADRGGLGQAACRVPGRAHGGRNHSGFVRPPAGRCWWRRSARPRRLSARSAPT